MTAVTTDTLMSKIRTDRELMNIHSTNIAQAEVKGYTRKGATSLTLASAGQLSGVRLSEITRVIDSVLQIQTRQNNSISSEQAVMNEYLQRVSLAFGNRGEEATFSHQLGRFTSCLAEVTGNVTAAKKNEAVFFGVDFADGIRHFAKQVNDYRSEVDQQLLLSVNAVNDLTAKIANQNKLISQMIGRGANSSNLEDMRDTYIHELSGQLGIKVYEGDNKMLYIYTSSGRPLVQEFDSYPIAYTSSNLVVPGQVLSDITQGATVITSELSGGKISGLLSLRDVFLPDMQAELDELTRVVRDTVNAIHNEGTAIGGPSTLTGTVSVPGLGTALTGTTVISGAGTVRLGVVDSEGTLLDYKDVALTDNMTINGLLSAVSGAPYVTSNPSGAFSMTQLGTGEIQLTSTNGYTISIGAAGTVKPELSLGATFDATTALGFSHFLGMNNFFTTGDDLASSASQVGVANQLNVRADIISNQRYMATGRLSNQVVPAPTAPGQALGVSKTDITLDIVNQLKGGQLQFNTAGILAASRTNSIEYAERIIAATQLHINAVSDEADLTKTIYDELAMRANDISGVNISEEMLEIYRLSASQQVTSQALAIVMESQKNLYQTIGRV